MITANHDDVDEDEIVGTPPLPPSRTPVKSQLQHSSAKKGSPQSQHSSAKKAAQVDNLEIDTLPQSR